MCCLLFSVSLAFAIMNWRNEPGGILKEHHLQNVSIYVLHGLVPPEKVNLFAMNLCNWLIGFVRNNLWGDVVGFDTHVQQYIITFLKVFQVGLAYNI